MTFLQEIANFFVIYPWVLIVLIIWCLVWELLALWKSARKKHLVWFIVLGLTNTLGILEILYLFIFSDKIKTRKSENIQSKSRINKRK
jgi:uncharacterized membrane protein